MFCCPRGFCSEGKNASTSRDNNDSIELEFKTVA